LGLRRQKLSASSRQVTSSSRKDSAASLGDLSLVIVLASLYPVVTVLLARIRLGEQLGSIQRVGAVVAFAGVACIVAG
jgi:drug/metabolite transporter (DMT)-like permease